MYLVYSNIYKWLDCVCGSFYTVTFIIVVQISRRFSRTDLVFLFFKVRIYVYALLSDWKVFRFKSVNTGLVNLDSSRNSISYSSTLWVRYPEL